MHACKLSSVQMDRDMSSMMAQARQAEAEARAQAERASGAPGRPQAAVC